MAEPNIQNHKLIGFFEQCYEDGDKAIQLQGIPSYIREEYKKYYAWRNNEEQKKNMET